MTKQSPFFLAKVECPVCKTINEFECIKVGAYLEHNHDTDFCPTNREWQDPKYQVFNPLLFFMATCSHCFYTREFRQSFKEWKSDTHFKTYHLKRVQMRHLEALAEESSVLRRLGETLEPVQSPFATAVCKFLLGIYDELLLERPRKLDLGRFFLRIAWLFREHYGRPEKVADHSAFFAKDIEKALIKIRHSRENLDASVENITRLVEDQFTQRSDWQRGEDFMTVHNGFKDSLFAIAEIQKQLDDHLSTLGTHVQANKQLAGQIVSNLEAEAVPYGGASSFENFLSELKSKWDFVPLSEDEALLQAIECYRDALESGHEIQPGNQQIQATYLIAELSRRVSRHAEAKQYFNNAIKLGQQFIFDNRGDNTRTALARKILELAVEQGKRNLSEIPA
jgi:uncharacterized protein (DUF2225 family)